MVAQLEVIQHEMSVTFSEVPRAQLKIIQREMSVPFPEISRDQLIQKYVADMKNGKQCHPRLQYIHKNHAVFTSEIRYPVYKKYNISYIITCNVPLTDPILQKEQPINLLYCTESLPYLEFRAINWCDDSGIAVSGPH